VLLRLSAAGAEPAELLTIQTGYSAMIRACFAEADYRRLGDACHQRLEFSGRLTLAPRASGGRPRFSLDVASRTFPRGSLNEGWELGSLRRADRVWERDPACSYRRLLSYDPDTGRYVPDRPLPECSLYSLP
jgi:hypothetical protein